MKKPLVSVIIPVKNGERFLNESINSILDQDYPSIEIIVVDGQSADNTEKIAKSFKEVKYIYQHSSPSIAHAKNLGILNARGEFVAFISHDDLWPTHKLSKQVEYMLQHPKVQYTIARVKFFLEPGCSVPPSFRKELLNGDHVGKMPETLVVRRTLFHLIGLFNSEFMYMEDTDWFDRAKLNNIDMYVVQDVLLYKRIHDTNVSYDRSKIRKINMEIFNILKESIGRNHCEHS